MRERADVRPAGLARGAAGDELEQPALVEDGVEPARGVAEKRGLLLQIDIDAAEENRRVGGRGSFVERERQIHRQHHGVVPLADEFLGQRIVPQADAAVVAARARREQEDFHPANSGWSTRPACCVRRPAEYTERARHERNAFRKSPALGVRGGSPQTARGSRAPPGSLAAQVIADDAGLRAGGTLLVLAHVKPPANQRGQRPRLRRIEKFRP